MNNMWVLDTLCTINIHHLRRCDTHHCTKFPHTAVTSIKYNTSAKNKCLSVIGMLNSIMLRFLYFLQALEEMESNLKKETNTLNTELRKDMDKVNKKIADENTKQALANARYSLLSF
jgi:hypothetical protein